MIVIVDTNVAIVANKKADHASPECVVACIERLEQLMDMDTLVLDDQWCILREYMDYLHSEGQPGVGDRFLRWILLNRASERVAHVHITPTDPTKTDFVEFPSNPELEKFNRSDRMFVAVTLAHPDHPPILNAVDADWVEFKQALANNGVRVESLCPADLDRLVSGTS
ncbi:MAG: hypothetical protein IAE80_08740 [Anaerolinea sp.]|nr:hypothetical protein [Anaerolinea sp.]